MPSGLDLVQTGVNAIPGFGQLLSGAIGILRSIGLTIKGKTEHFSYDQIEPVAKSFADSAFPKFRTAYTDDECISIAQKVQGRLLSKMQTVWGLAATNSLQIARDVQDPSRVNVSGVWVLWLYLHHYFLWIGQNIDAANPESFQKYFTDMWPDVFSGAITDAGLDISKLAPVTTTGPTGGGTGGTGTGGGGSSAGSGASNTTLALVALGVVAAVYLVSKK